jgi:transcriptional regulator with XRE-family HTH domain
MLAGELIVEARRRAGLTQQQLAERVGRPQSTIARWESGVQAPSIDTTREVVRACGLELTVGLARYDDSYLPLIDRQLRLSPAKRLGSLCPDGFDPVPTLAALTREGVRQTLIGRAAGALHGSPLIVSPPELVVVPADEPENEQALEAAMFALGAEKAPLDDFFAGLHAIEPWLLPERTRVAVVRRPAGTQGYRDLRRDAATVVVGDGVTLYVASLIDLVRIAEASPRLDDRADSVALRTTLERVSSPGSEEKRKPREIIASWQRARV